MIEILAHRGYWRHKAEQNTPAALRDALTCGMGIETDIRDYDEGLVIAHDIPNATSPTLEAFRSILQEEGFRGTLALNIKSDGLAPLCAKYFSPWRDQLFFFDMSVPDMRAYLNLDLPVFTRHSDVEAAPTYYHEAAGVWLDQLNGEWIAPETIRAHLEAKKRVAIVSSELHGRDPERLWQIVGLFRDDARVALCTDHVDHAREVFGIGGESE